MKSNNVFLGIGVFMIVVHLYNMQHVVIQILLQKVWVHNFNEYIIYNNYYSPIEFA